MSTDTRKVSLADSLLGGLGDNPELTLDDISELLATTDASRHIGTVLRLLGRGQNVEVIASDELLTTTEAARRLSVSRRILLRMIDTGELRAMTLPGSDHRRILAREVARVLRAWDDQFWAPVDADDMASSDGLTSALTQSAASADAA